jgi:hypothetical protein
MTRFLFVLALACCALSISPAHADSNSYGARAYAPENLSQLNVNDQIRVIENEYREQSRVGPSAKSGPISPPRCAAAGTTAAGAHRATVTGTPAA